MNIDAAWIAGPSNPSLRNAATLVPEVYPKIWSWFIEHEGETWDRLPHRTLLDDGSPFRVAGIPISRDAGIYRPGVSHVSWANRVMFALTVHNSSNGGYRDIPPLDLGDGTWTIKYSQHITGADRGEAKGQDYNSCLLNCLEYGVPVGVIFSEGGPYKIMGLAYVERYDAFNCMFTLHGPVRPEKEATKLFTAPAFEFNSGLASLSDCSETEHIRYEMKKMRVGQERFRRRLLTAYEGACAATGVNVEEALQAAHIESYNGPKSQHEYNGILFRSDIHLLFDAHLLTVDPSDLRLAISNRLEDTEYVELNGRRLRVPSDPLLHPKRRLLDAHFNEFQYIEMDRRGRKLG